MKATAKIFILFLAVNSVILMVPQKAAAQVSINFQMFYDDLSPYGYWIDTPKMDTLGFPMYQLRLSLTELTGIGYTLM